jgi:hypothetical protein
MGYKFDPEVEEYMKETDNYDVLEVCNELGINLDEAYIYEVGEKDW